MSKFIEPKTLEMLIQRDFTLRGLESAIEIISREPNLPFP